MSTRNPILPPAIGFVLGILLGVRLDFPTAPLATGLAVFCIALAVARRKGWLLSPAFAMAGMLWAQWHRPGPPPVPDVALGEVSTVTGCVVEPPSFSETKETFVIETKPSARMRVTAYAKDDHPPPRLNYGQQVVFEGKVREPRNFGNPGAFDFAGFLARRQIYWTASVRSGTQPLITGECGNKHLALLYGLRSRILERIESMYAGDDYAIGVLEALLVGESARFERAWSEQYRRTGTYHAIVVSGLHVTVIAASIVTLLKIAPFSGPSARLLAALLIWIYAGICGWQAPVVRSAGGFTLFAIGGWFYRDTRLLNLLALLTIGFLFMDPRQIDEASFQLTFLCVLLLGALAAPATKRLSALARGIRGLHHQGRDLHVEPRVAQFRIELRLIAETLTLLVRLPNKAAARIVGWTSRSALWIGETFLVSAAIQFGLALPMIFLFHRLSVSGLTANLIVTPLLTTAVPIGFLAVITGWQWAAFLTKTLVAWSQAAVSWHADWDPNWRIPDPPLWAAALLAASLLALMLLPRRWLLLPAASMLGLLAWHPFPPDAVPGTLELTMIDVGQGESLLVGLPDGRWMLVDGGGIPVFGNRPRTSSMDIGEDVVSPYLWSRGIRRIDIIASTHQHEDHAGGLGALIENFRPSELWAGATPDSPIWSAIMSRAAANGTKVRKMRRGDRAPFMEVLGPAADYVPRAAPSNNDSLVLLLRHGTHSFLLTGDTERASEYGLLDGLPHVDVVKVAHHGSKTSTTEAFLAATTPVFGLISAGKDNLFRHPHPEVVSRLQERHAGIFRTDQSGLITIRSDGRRLTAETYR